MAGPAGRIRTTLRALLRRRRAIENGLNAIAHSLGHNGLLRPKRAQTCQHQIGVDGVDAPIPDLREYPSLQAPQPVGLMLIAPPRRLVGMQVTRDLFEARHALR